MTAVRDLHTAATTAPALKRLSREQVAAWERDGLLYLPGLFSADEMAPLRHLVHDEPTIEKNLVEIVDSTGGKAELYGWSGEPDDVLGVFVRIARMVEIAEDLLGGLEVYHWHSKLSLKKPRSTGRWDWHQDYGSWYLDGCLRPEMLSIMVAVDPVTRDNGCVELLRGSHLMGRIDHMAVGESRGADPEVVAEAAKTMERVDCAMEPGDAVAFHGNTLHASGPNRSDDPRTLLHVSYNTARNRPWKGYEQHAYTPLDRLPDDTLATGAFRAGIDRAAVGERWTRRARALETVSNLYGYRIDRRAGD